MSFSWNNVGNTLDTTDNVLDIVEVSNSMMDIADKADKVIQIPGVLGPGVVALAEMSRNRARNQPFWVETGYVVEAVVKDAIVGYGATRITVVCFTALGGPENPGAWVAGASCGVSTVYLGREIAERIQITDWFVTTAAKQSTTSYICRPMQTELTSSVYPYYAYPFNFNCKNATCFPDTSVPMGSQNR